MTKVLVTESYLGDIADAIRQKLKVATQYKPSQMAGAIESIPIATSDVYVGTGEPSQDVGSDGNYYYKRYLKNFEYGCTTNPSNSSSTSMSGYEFKTVNAISVKGLRGYSRTSGTGKLFLAAVDGTVLGQIDGVQFAAGGWTEAYFETPIQLSADTNYIVMVRRSQGALSYQTKSQATVNANITAIAGRYDALPGSVDSSNLYGADILIEKNPGVYLVDKQYIKQSGSWVQIA